jgi:hypothetical protein
VGAKKAAAMIEVENFMILIMLPTLKYVSFLDVFVVYFSCDEQHRKQKVVFRFMSVGRVIIFSYAVGDVCGLPIIMEQWK